MTSSAMFTGNSLGPLLGGAIAAGFGLRWVFLLSAAVMALNLVWLYYRIPEYTDATTPQGGKAKRLPPFHAQTKRRNNVGRKSEAHSAIT